MPERSLTGPARWSLRTRLLLLLAAVAVLLGGTLAAQIVLQSRQRNVREDLLRRVDPAVVASADLRASIVDQETGVRGYGLTGDPDFRESYAAGAEDTAAALDRLEALLVSGSDLSSEVADLQQLVDDWKANTARPVLDADTEAERAIVRSEAFQGEGLRRLGDLRASIADVDEQLIEERDTLVENLDAAASRATWAMVLQVGGVVLSGMLLLVALARVVVGPISRLGRDARMVADGDLRHPVRGEGSPDLARLGADVDAMRARILAELGQLNEAKADLEQQTQELARSNADLEQFAYVASHDLQEPLRKVSSFCQLLQKRYGGQLDERADQYIDYAVDGAKRMQDLINDLLAFSRVGRTTEAFETVDLGDVVDEVLEVLGPAINDARATVTVGDLPTVWGDRRLLVAAVQNLVANAIKFRRRDPLSIDIAATLGGVAGDEWIVSITDNGIGVDADYGDQIFVIFKRLHGKAEYPGTGIGLALAKKIVEFHGGRIWLEPTAPPGSTFKIALPVHPTTTGRSAADAG